MFFCFSPKRTEEKKSLRSRRVRPLFVRVSKMAKKSYQKMQPMTAKEKQLRTAEAAGVAQFLMNASIPKHTGGGIGPRTVKIKNTRETAVMAATLLQKMWRKITRNQKVSRKSRAHHVEGQINPPTLAHKTWQTSHQARISIPQTSRRPTVGSSWRCQTMGETSSADGMTERERVQKYAARGSEMAKAATPVPAWLQSTGIRTWVEAHKVVVITSYCFLANTILLLGRNIGATLLLSSSLGADALPYVMVLVGLLVMVVMPVVASLATKYSSNTVLDGTTVVMLLTLAGFFVLFTTGLADLFAIVVYPLFFVLEEVIDSLLMVLFWQIGMACFTKEEATRLIGIVNMGAACANLANGLLVALLIRFAPGGSFAILPAQMVLLCVQLIPNRVTRQWVPPDGAGAAAAAAKKAAADAADAADAAEAAAAAAAAPPAATAAEPLAKGSCLEETSKGVSGWLARARKRGGLLDPDAWYMHPLTQQIAVWQFLTVLLFSTIEFQYNSTLAHFLDADGIAQVTANLASVASVGQTIVNLLITPFLLQKLGVWAALLVTPAAYIAGEGYILTAQVVTTVFVCRAMDFIFRYTISDNTKQILYKYIPSHQLIEARAFTDGTIKKLGPMALGFILIVVQYVSKAEAYALVYPLAFAGALMAGALMPLVLNLATISAESEKTMMC